MGLTITSFDTTNPTPPMRIPGYLTAVLTALLFVTPAVLAAEKVPWLTAEYKAPPSVLAKFLVRYPQFFSEGATITAAGNPQRIVMRNTQEAHDAMRTLVDKYYAVRPHLTRLGTE
jgi:hypothetical protein